MIAQVQDEYYMRMALEIAKKGLGRTSPNPVVGAVIVNNDGKIVGQGWHQKAGTPHAEIHALREAGEASADATLYVTLEPCCHHGRTGPCTDAVISSKIRRVVYAMTDPNPSVAGCGAQQLRQAGIEVTEGVLACEAARLNQAFIKFISTGLPFVTIKMAMTLDGKIATATGQSQWITGEAARKRVHELRDQYDAVLIGNGTAIADNPQLTVRHTPGRNPVRIVLDSKAQISLDSHLIRDGAAPTIIAVSQAAPAIRLSAYTSAGVEVIKLPTVDSGLDLKVLLCTIAQRGLTSVLVEGGALLNASLLEANLADNVIWFVAPKLIGGVNAPGPVGGTGVDKLNQAYALEDMAAEFIGDDLMITANIKAREGRDVYRDCGRIRYNT